MYPLHQGNELFLQISSNPQQHEHRIPEDPIFGFDGSGLAENHMGKIRLPPKLFVEDNDENCSGEIKKQKMMMHRDIERQRRQEMATLHASLRCLLPLEFIKGKRSISDHVNEAVNYIKHLEKKIKVFETKRDELKSLSDQEKGVRVVASEGGRLSTNDFSCMSNVKVQPCLGGVEIVISSGFKDKGLLLSRFLGLLLKDGLTIVSCASVKVNEKLLHSIKATVDDPICFDMPGLQQKLSQLK